MPIVDCMVSEIWQELFELGIVKGLIVSSDYCRVEVMVYVRMK